MIEATFRLCPQAHATRTLSFDLPTLQILAQVLAKLSDCSILTAAVQLEIANHEPLRVTVRVEGLTQAIDGKVNQVVTWPRSGGAVSVEALADDAWDRRKTLFDSRDACVCKVSVLPTRWAEVCKLAQEGLANGA